ncbi:MAG: peptidase domain-containing ABC transporter, partial [Candidatus Competibacteraceae bacterium]|nr:peptidase domain-containing ABC transporter [Candidatus Competibacteraceae bacterium]
MNAPPTDAAPSVPPRLSLMRCVFLIAMHHGVQLAVDKLLGIGDRDPVKDMFRLMSDSGLAVKSLERRKWKTLIALGGAFPAMAQLKEGYWVIVANAVLAEDGNSFVAVLDPRNEQSGMALVARKDFVTAWTGRLVLCKRKPAEDGSDQPFGLLWFVREVMRDGRYLADVAVAALMSTAISFATPLFFNIMIDKVVPHQSYQTLLAIVLAFVLVTIFDGVFTYMRQYLMLFATNKIDARLAVRTFDHLLKLPMSFFE